MFGLNGCFLFFLFSCAIVSHGVDPLSPPVHKVVASDLTEMAHDVSTMDTTVARVDTVQRVANSSPAGK